MTAWDKLLAKKPIIGMLHLKPLPGAPMAEENIAAISEAMLADADALVAGGCHALMMENFGDAPFFPGTVPAITACVMTRLAHDVRREFPNVPLGINVLRNDGLTALAVAHAVGAAFIRVNVLCGARVTDQGLIQGIAHELLRERRQLGATSTIKILADVDVKHSAPLAARPLEDEVQDTQKRGLADALIVSGSGTGAAVDPAKLRTVKQAAGSKPVLIGSGATPDTVRELATYADGFIVGTAFKRDGLAANPVERSRVEAIVRALK